MKITVFKVLFILNSDLLEFLRYLLPFKRYEWKHLFIFNKRWFDDKEIFLSWQGSLGTRRKSFFPGKVQKEGSYFFPVVVLIVTSLSWERNCSRLLGQCIFNFLRMRTWPTMVKCLLRKNKYAFLCPFCRIFCILLSQAVFHNLPHFSLERDYKVTSAVHYVKIPT